MKFSFLILFVCFACVQLCQAQDKLHVVLAGLSHDHVNGTLDKNKKGEIVIVGIVESDGQLCDKKKAAYQLPDSIFYKDLKDS